MAHWNIALGLGLLAAIIGGWKVLPSNSPAIAAWVPVLTTAMAAIAAHWHAGRFEPLISAYQDTERQLKFREARWNDLPADKKTREKQAEFIHEWEDIMASENDAWRAEWMREEKSDGASLRNEARVS